MPRIVFTLEDGQQLDVEFSEDGILIGRHKDCDVQLLCASVSNRHARVVPDDERWVLRDLGSTNGSDVNGQCALEGILLRDGDHIRCGDILGVVYLDRIVGEPGEAQRVAGPPSAVLDDDVDEVSMPELKASEPDEGAFRRHPRRKGKKFQAKEDEEVPLAQSPRLSSHGNSDILEELNRIRRVQNRPTVLTWVLALLLLLLMVWAGLSVRHFLKTGRWTLLPEIGAAQVRTLEAEWVAGGDATN